MAGIGLQVPYMSSCLLCEGWLGACVSNIITDPMALQSTRCDDSEVSPHIPCSTRAQTSMWEEINTRPTAVVHELLFMKSEMYIWLYGDLAARQCINVIFNILSLPRKAATAQSRSGFDLRIANHERRLPGIQVSTKQRPAGRQDKAKLEPGRAAHVPEVPMSGFGGTLSLH